MHVCVYACTRVSRHSGQCALGAVVLVFLSVDMTVLGVSQASSVLRLLGGQGTGGGRSLWLVWPVPEPAPFSGGLSHPRVPVNRAIPASRPPACHLCWLNLGACVQRLSQVPSHMGGRI